MIDWWKQVHPAKKQIGVGASAVIFMFSTFATFRYVDAKYDPMLKALREIRSMIVILDGRVYELNGRRGPPPPKPVRE